MWHKFLLALLFLLALAADELVPIDLASEVAPTPAYSLYKLQTESTLSEDIADDSYSVPRFYRLNASIFTNENQQSPNYVLEIEFFEVKLSASLYKHLANPPTKINWFELVSFTPHSSRISGWKDGNFLYVSRDIYLS